MTDELEPGQLYVTTTGRTVEIVAVDDVADEWHDTINAIAYKYVGATTIHLRGAHAVKRWARVEGG